MNAIGSKRKRLIQAGAAALAVSLMVAGCSSDEPGGDGNQSLAPGENNEKGETVCEVKQEGEWPQITRPDGPSIYLTDIQAESLNDGKLWKRSEKGVDHARANAKTEVFNGTDIGSPGMVPGLSGAVAAAPPGAAPPRPATRPGNKIDY